MYSGEWNMVSVDPIWFFIIYAIIIVIIILTYLKKKRYNSSGRFSGNRIVAVWVSGAVLLTAFLGVNVGTLGSMDIDGQISDGRNLVYGEYVGELVEFAKNNVAEDMEADEDFMEEITTADVNSFTATEEYDDSLQISLTTLNEIPESWIQVNPEGARTSSFLKKFPPTMMIDGKVSTSWQAEIDDPEAFNNDPSRSEWIGFGFHSSSRIDYIVISNGTPDTEKRYYKNGRAREVCIATQKPGDPGTDGEAEPEWTQEVELRDEPVYQIIKCNNLNAFEVYIKIDSMYIGTDYSELCVTDVMFFAEE